MRTVARACAALLLAPGCLSAAAGSADFRVPPKLSRQAGYYYLETVVKVPLPLEKAVPVARDFGDFPGWALDGINERSGGEPYNIDFTGLGFVPEAKTFRIGMRLNVLFKGDHTLPLKVTDELDASPPRILVRTDYVGRLVKELQGEFTAAPLSEEAFEIRFQGRARLHWFFYLFVPLRVLADDIQDRIETFLRNFAARAAYMDAKARSPGFSK